MALLGGLRGQAASIPLTVIEDIIDGSGAAPRIQALLLPPSATAS